MCEPRGVAKIISLSWPYKVVKNFKQMRCCWSFFRKNTDFIYPPRAGMNCIFVKFRWLFWNVWLHQTTLKASHILACICVECKQRCVLQFAAWLTFLRQNKYTGTVLVQPSGETERNSKKYCSFIHTEMTTVYLFICIRSRRRVGFWSANLISQISRLYSLLLFGKGCICTCKVLICWLSYNDHNDMVSNSYIK